MFKKKVVPEDDFQGFVRSDCLAESPERQMMKWRLLNISVQHVASSPSACKLQALPFIGRFF